MCTICGVLMHIMLFCCKVILRFTLFCHKIRFVAIYALLRGEKLSKKLCLWRKKDKYHVWSAAATRVYYIGKWSCAAIFAQTSIKFFSALLANSNKAEGFENCEGLAEICISTFINLIALLIFSSGGQR